MSRKVPFREGLFIEKPDGPCLTGNRCRACGRIYFPVRSLCFDCLSEDLEPIGFGGEGKLYSYTISYMPSFRFEAPFFAGWVSTTEGVRVFAPLVIEEEGQLRIGMNMALLICELWREGETSIVGYKYRPL